MKKPTTTTKTNFDLVGVEPTVDSLIEALQTLKKEVGGNPSVDFWQIASGEDKALSLDCVEFFHAIHSVGFNLRNKI